MDAPVNDIPPLEDILNTYRPSGLLAHEYVVKRIAETVRNLPSVIPESEIKDYLAMLTIWPLVEMYKISHRAIGADIGSRDREKLDELRVKFRTFSEGEDVKRVTENLDVEKSFDLRFLNPYTTQKQKFLDVVLSVMCEPLEDHMRNTHQSKNKLLHDAQMGGTIYVVGNAKGQEKPRLSPVEPNAAYSFLQRSFICIDKDGKPILFMDNIEGGNPYFKHLDHWRGFDEAAARRTYGNRVHEVFYAFAASMYMAKKLGLDYIVPRDYELSELSRLLGMREKRVFSPDQTHWKTGLHSKQRQSGVYAHSLYRATVKNNDGHQLKHPHFTIPPFENSDQMLVEFRKLESEIYTSNTNRRAPAPKTYERLRSLIVLSDMINEHPLTPQYVREAARNATRAVLGVISPLMSERMDSNH